MLVWVVITAGVVVCCDDVDAADVDALVVTVVVDDAVVVTVATEATTATAVIIPIFTIQIKCLKLQERKMF